MPIRRVENHQWPIVGWLWQAFRNDLADVVHSYPAPDGRYNTAHLDGWRDGPTPGRCGYLAWTTDPRRQTPSPVGFCLLNGLDQDVHTLGEMWVAPVVRGRGLGRELVAHAVGHHPGRWQVAFQQDNARAGKFWRARFAEHFANRWREEGRAVPGRPDLPPDQWLLSLAGSTDPDMPIGPIGP